MKTIKDRVSQILHEALSGYDQSARYRTEDGFVRWGLVEKDIIAAVDESPAPTAVIDWQPIETAPKDGTRVLVYFETGGAPVVYLAWYDSFDEWERLVNEGHALEQLLPTHWAPWNGPEEGQP